MLLISKKISIVLLLLISSSSFCQKYSSIISDTEIIRFLDWKLGTENKYWEEPKNRPKQLFYKLIKWDTATFFPARKKDNSRVTPSEYLFPTQKKWKWIDTIFSQEDIEYFFLQSTSEKDSIWSGDFKNTEIAIKIKQKRPTCNYLSLPLFSIDKKYVIIKHLFYCGRSCAYREFRVYRRKEDNTWELLGKANEWMS